MKHWCYFKYVLRHKYWVFVAGLMMGARPWSTPRLFWRLLIHDWSKFLPSEWGPCAQRFYGKKQKRDGFMKARYLHRQRNDHHSSYWDKKEMSPNACFEMVADWAGAGKAKQGNWKVITWYKSRRSRLKLHKKTKAQVDAIFNKMRAKGWN